MFLNVCKQIFHISRVRISQKVKKWFNKKFSTYYFHMKTKILTNFQSCNSVPLSWSTWKSSKDIFFEYFLQIFPKTCAISFAMSSDNYMKWKLDYFIFILHIQFFLDGLEFQVNQENISRIFPHLDWIRRDTVSLCIQAECEKMREKCRPE